MRRDELADNKRWWLRFASPPCEAACYFVFGRDRFRKANASGPHILIITIAQEAMPTKASMTVRAISMACA